MADELKSEITNNDEAVIVNEEDSLENSESETVVPAYEHSQAEYKCFSCNKTIAEQYIKKKVRCPYCGSKIVFKARTREITIKAR